MRIFLINLDKNTDRLASTDAQLRHLNLPYERLQAVVGKDLTRAEKRRCWAKFHSWCVMGRVIQDGELGCALSHQAVYHRMVEESIPMALVLEDDCRLAESLPQALREAEAFLKPERSQVLLLTHHLSTTPPPGISQSDGAEMYAEGYVLTQEAARQLLRANTPIVSVADRWQRWVTRGFISLYKYTPAPISQAWDTFKSSDACPIPVPGLQDYTPFQRLLHPFKRLFGVAYDRLLWHLFRR